MTDSHRPLHPSVGPHLAAVPDAADDPRVFVKRAGADPERRRIEADVLSTFRHPGAVELLGTDESPSAGPSLRLAKITDGTDLLHHPPLDGEQLVAVFGRISQTLGELHAAGWVHGNVGAEHVIVDGRLNAILCGFGNVARLRSEERPDGLDASLDTVALGRLLDREIDRSAELDDDPLHVPLRHLAGLATAHNVTGVTPDIMATRLHDLAADSRPPTAARSDQHDTRRSMPRVPPTVFVGVGCIAAVALLVFVGLLLGRTESRQQTIAIDRTDEAEATPEAIPPGTRAPELVLATPKAATSESTAATCGSVDTSQPTADVDGDGCVEPWTVVGGLLTVNAQRFALGDADDLVTVGDWDCDGTATPALVSVATGDVFMFTSWPERGTQIEVTSAGLVPTPTSAMQNRTGSCDQLVVESADGTIARFGGIETR